jgi:cellulose synthase/poly-beta-1,6-N-acetylglucosamine synthase-like glycosyltransferase
MPQLSVIIIGRNEGQRLIDCIQSVQAMNYPSTEMEIIYVDSDSTDDSPQRAQALGVHVEIVHPQRPAAAIGRNAGWRIAKAPFILFLDGDTLLHPDFVKAALQQFKENPNLAIVWGHRRELYPTASIYQQVLDLDWIYPPGPSAFCGGDALMRRHVLEEVDGYNPLLIAGEEPEMCARIRARGYTILHIDHPMTLHDLAITRWTQYWRRASRTGHAYAEIFNLLRNTATPLWQRETRKNFLHANVLLDIFLVGVILTFWFYSPWPLFLSMTLLVLLCLRSAWKARWKSNGWLTLVLYGVHSQFQQIPIALGQLSYYYYRGLGQRRRLVEYK